MKSRILAFEKVLYGSDFDDPEDGWTKYLDIDSAVDYYLAKEFTKENDSDFYRSKFFYIARLHQSPIVEVLHGPDLGLRPQRRRQARAAERHDDREPDGLVAARQRLAEPQHHARPTGTSR